MEKIIKFTPELTELIKNGIKTTTFRVFDEKDLSEGDKIILATRDGEKVTEFGRTEIICVKIRTISTIQPEDYEGHEVVEDPFAEYVRYYGDKVTPNTELKVIKFGKIDFN